MKFWLCQLIISVSVHSKGVWKVWCQDCLQATWVSPHQTHQTMALWFWLCAYGHSHAGTEKVATWLEVHFGKRKTYKRKEVHNCFITVEVFWRICPYTFIHIVGVMIVYSQTFGHIICLVSTFCLCCACLQYGHKRKKKSMFKYYLVLYVPFKVL